MSSVESRLVLYAPNVHTGGGLVLLAALLEAWPSDQILTAWLDRRAQHLLSLPAGAQVHWVRPQLGSRAAAEWSLTRHAVAGSVLLCFHGLPPLFPNRAQVHVFLQNRLLLGAAPLAGFGWRVRLRLRMEQITGRWRRHAVHRFWVQSESMARELQAWWGQAAPAPVAVRAFVPALPQARRGAERLYDFVYVADGVAHKNHRTLIDAWVLLAQHGLRPSLALTLPPRDAALATWVLQMAQAHGLDIRNLGQLDHEVVLSVYEQAGALVFPSLLESFGLPLIEARSLGLPILAPESDYVRDVCEPVQTFDPRSAVSIARAVRRFLEQPELPASPVDAGAFLGSLLDLSR